MGIEPQSAAKMVTLGRIVGVFGIRGWLKVQSFARPRENLLNYPSWWIGGVGGFESKVFEAKPHGEVFVARLGSRTGAVIEDRNLAETFIGAELQVPLSALPPPPKGSYYWADLIGLSVESESGDSLGRVRELLDNGAQDVLVVEDGETERLIPFVRGPIVQRVDMDAKLIVVDWERDY